MKAGAWERTQASCDARRALPAHGRHAAGALCRGRDAAWANGAVQRGRQAIRARGWAGPRRGGLAWEAGAAAGQAGFGRGPRSEAAARERRKALFNYVFNKILNTSFQISF